MKVLEHPHMRMQLEGVLASLADVEHQTKVWLAPTDIERTDSFTLCVNVLFDDLLLGERDEQELVGDIVVDEEEARCIKNVIRLLDNLLEELGPEASDAQYVQHPRWLDIVTAANAAMTLMKDNRI